VLNAIRVFQFVDRAGVGKSVVQKLALHNCELKEIEATKRNTHHPKKVLRMDGSANPVAMKKLNY
jgi:hypothetical protein